MTEENLRAKGYVEVPGKGLVKMPAAKPGMSHELPHCDELEQHKGSERDLHDKIIEHCKSRRWVYFHGSMAHRARRTAGECDFTILADAGRVFFIEAKTASGKLTPEQAGLILAASILGHAVHVVRSFEQFLEIVK